MTTYQPTRVWEALQRNADDDFGNDYLCDSDDEEAATALAPLPERITIFNFTDEVLTSEPSIIHDGPVPSEPHHHHHDVVQIRILSDLPVEILVAIFEALPVLHRVNLALCSKLLAQVATRHAQLDLAFADRDELSDRPGFFADPKNFPHLWSRRTPTPNCEFSFFSLGGEWCTAAVAEIERQGATYTPGIHAAIELWFITAVDPNDERIAFKWGGWVCGHRAVVHRCSKVFVCGKWR